MSLGSEIDQGHFRLIDYMQAFGYQSNEDGVCFGLAHMGVQAILSKDLPTFDARLKMLLDNDIYQIAEKLEATKQKRAQLAQAKTLNIDNMFTAEELALLDIAPFLEGIELYFQPEFYPHLFENHSRPFLQNTKLTAPLVISDKIVGEGGLIEANRFCGIYNKEDLIRYFNSLKRALKDSKPEFKAPFALSIVSNDHAISLGYDGVNWIFIDSNSLPTQYIQSDDEIADKIMATLSTNENACFRTKVYVTENNHQALLPVLLAWQNDPQFKSIHSVKANAKKADRTDSKGNSWFLIAAQDDQLEIIQQLFRENPALDINQMNDEGFNALQLAALAGYSDIVAFLVKHGANIDAQNYYENTPLHFAVLSGQLEVVQQLFKAKPKPEINKTDNQGRTALHFAADNGFSDIVDFLIKQGANIDPKDKWQATPLAAATNSGHFEVVKQLFVGNPKQNINHVDVYGTTALHWAAQGGFTDIVDFLLRQGANINAKDNLQKTPLILAVKYGHLAVIKRLFAESPRPDFNLQDEDGYTALDWSQQAGFTDIADFLLKQGATIEIQAMPQEQDENIDANTNVYAPPSTLIEAVLSGSLDVVKQYFNTNPTPEINKTDNHGCTGLHWAAQQGFTDIVAYLVDKGANINAKEKMRYTPLALAAIGGHLDIVKILQTDSNIDMKNIDGCSALHIAATNGFPDIVVFLLKHRADIDLQDNLKFTSLARAANSGHIGIVKLLLEANPRADINRTNIDGHTALYQAALCGHKDIVALLLDEGAQIDIKGKDEKTILELVGIDKEIIELIRTHHKTKLNAENRKAKTLSSISDYSSDYQRKRNFFQNLTTSNASASVTSKPKKKSP